MPSLVAYSTVTMSLLSSLNLTVNTAVPPSTTASASAIDRWRGSSLSRIVPSPTALPLFRIASSGSCSSTVKLSFAPS